VGRGRKAYGPLYYREVARLPNRVAVGLSSKPYYLGERMYAVYELFAIAAGATIGLLSYTTAIRPKIATVILGSVIVGAFVSFISGELLVSWAYLVFDVAQVLIAAGVTVTLVAVWRRKATRSA
jgi:hypothetical protein